MNTKGIASQSSRKHGVSNEPRGELNPDCPQPVETVLVSFGKRWIETNADLTHLLSVASAWAYVDKEEELQHRLELLVPGAKFTVRRFGSSNDALLVHAVAYLIQSEDGQLCILAFQGTPWKNATSWLVDANVHATQMQDLGRVHGGFSRNVAVIYQDIKEALNRVYPSEAGRENPDTQTLSPGAGKKEPAFYITGHSLGGGMAALAAAMLWNDPDLEFRDRIRRVLRNVSTFGQPMVGDASFAKSCDETKLSEITHRYVYKNDLVPRFPPRSTGKFSHFGKDFVCGEQGWIRASQPLSQLYTGLISNLIGLMPFVLDTFTFTRWINLNISWSDHSPINYIWCSQIQKCSNLFG